MNHGSRRFSKPGSPSRSAGRLASFGAVAAFVLFVSRASAQGSAPGMLAKPGAFTALTEPPCSYCSSENRKGFVRPDDPVIAWIRGVHNGGAIPLRHFLSAPRIINDTYGLFFYDPDGGYVSAFKKDSGYSFHGWRRGVMVVRGPDGTLWSALTGLGIDGPKKGQRLERLPSLMTQWGHWLMLHPESTAYNLFDGAKYPVAELPRGTSAEARETMGKVDGRLEAFARVLGVEVREKAKAFPLPGRTERACYLDEVDGVPVAAFWYGPTQSAVAFNRRLDGRVLTLYADDGSPETAPFKDRETGTRWTLAGRAVDGPLKGKELDWVPGVQCNWYAWAVEYPSTGVFRSAQ
jgi:hypothetical protein